MIYKWAALASLLLFSCLSKHVSTLITHHLAAVSPGFWRLPFTGFFLTYLSKTELTMSGAPSSGQTYWRETKQVSVQFDAAIVLHLSAREKEWISWDTKVNCFFAFVSIRSATIHLFLHVTLSLEILFSGKVMCSYIWLLSFCVMV